MAGSPRVHPDIRSGLFEQDRFDAVRDAVVSEDRQALVEVLRSLHAADIADVLEQLDDDTRQTLLHLWGTEFDSDVLAELDEAVAREILRFLPDEQVAEALRELESDEVVDLVEGLDREHRTEILESLDDVDRTVVRNSLRYPEDSAGRLMQGELVKAPLHWNVGQAIDFLRTETVLPENFYHIMLVDPQMKPAGQVALGALMRARRSELLCDIADDEFYTVSVLVDQEEVAYAFNQYHLISAPVLDEGGRLVGMITIDDAMKVLEEEARQDMDLMAGVVDHSLSDRILPTTIQRFPWLSANLATAVLASIVIALFDRAIEAIVALAVLMPIVASMGGNAGTQSMAVAVRAIATRDLTDTNAWRIVWRETMVGCCNGLIFAVIIGGIGMVWFGSIKLGAVLGVAVMLTMLVAGIAGILIPIGLERTRVDPALASGAFVTTVTDVVGFLAFLGLATALLI